MSVTIEEIEGAPEVRYASLLERADMITELILDGTLDPEAGLALAISTSPRLREVERTRQRFTPEAREQALALVAGGASYRLAASAALGDERFRMQVWRWARERQQRRVA